MSGDHDRAMSIKNTTHRCPDWDGLLINCEDPEFECCTCPQYNGGTLRFTPHETNELIQALEEAVYLLNPTEEDMQKKAGVYRIATALEMLKEKTKYPERDDMHAKAVDSQETRNKPEREGKERMITYSTNWMGPINAKWIEEHGDCWAGGRIDIYGLPDEPYPIEYSLPVMNIIDWEDFSVWLDDLETEELLSFEGILEKYFIDTGTVIQWWKDDTQEKNT